MVNIFLDNVAATWTIRSIYSGRQLLYSSMDRTAICSGRQLLHGQYGTCLNCRKVYVILTVQSICSGRKSIYGPYRPYLNCRTVRNLRISLSTSALLMAGEDESCILEHTSLEVSMQLGKGKPKRDTQTALLKDCMQFQTDSDQGPGTRTSSNDFENTSIIGVQRMKVHEQEVCIRYIDVLCDDIFEHGILITFTRLRKHPLHVFPLWTCPFKTRRSINTVNRCKHNEAVRHQTSTDNSLLCDSIWMPQVHLEAKH